MLAKRLFQKATAAHHRHRRHRRSPENASSALAPSDVDLRVILHYGIPSTASILAFDPIQNLLALGTLDGRIKVIGGDNVECLFVSPDNLPYKYLEFIHNEGYLMSITSSNSIQVWNLRSRSLVCSLHWETNITAFSVISGSHFVYIGDENGVVSVLQYDEEKVELLHLPYQLPSEASGFPSLVFQPVVGVLPQPCSSGTRVLIAYESGVIILWDILKAQTVFVRGDKVLQLKNEEDPKSSVDPIPSENTSPQSEEKEISAICWASCDGSIVAVGYVDGDILLWKTTPGKGTSPSPKNQESGLSDSVVKLQLSPTDKRLPIIVLQWCANRNFKKEGDGHLLIYGGDEIGSDEVITVLNLEWSSGMETVKCHSRVDVSLSGSFADIALTSGTMGRDNNVSLFILTSPGQLQIMDVASLAASVTELEKKSVFAVDFPPVIPTNNPDMTQANLFCLYTDVELLKTFAEEVILKKSNSGRKFSESERGPLTGGVCNHLSSDKDYQISRVYVAGYQDGSVQIWDATAPVLSHLCYLENKIEGVNVAISVAPVSKLEFCVHSLRLAVGDDCGLIRIYNLVSNDERSFHFVTKTTHEVQQLTQADRSSCKAAFSFFKSRVQALKFTNGGAKLAVGYTSGHVVVFDMHAFSSLYVTETLSSPISFCDIVLDDHAKNSNNSCSEDKCKNLLVILTVDGTVRTIDIGEPNLISTQQCLSKDATAVSLHVIDSSFEDPTVSSPRQNQQVSASENGISQPVEDTTKNVDNRCGVESQSSDNRSSGQLLDELLVLLCCTDIIFVYSAKLILQGDKKLISKVRLTKPCRWTTTFVKDGRVCGLLLLYQTGDMEIRSLPNLEVVKEYSLTSILKWNLKANVERMMSSTHNGHITLVNGSELAFLSVVSNENDFRIPESLPNLHDEVLADAAKAAISFSLKNNKKQVQGNGLGILRGIVKGFKREKFSPTDLGCASESFSSQLKDIFLRNPSPDPPVTSTEAELDIGFCFSITINHDIFSSLFLILHGNADDIEIDDEPIHLGSTSSHKVQDDRTEREKLLNDAGADVKPRVRTHAEVLAAYRKAGDASSAAGEARSKLLERQEKLQRINQRTEELRNGAEDFASMANELVKLMENRNRKWWQI